MTSGMRSCDAYGQMIEGQAKGEAPARGACRP